MSGSFLVAIFGRQRWKSDARTLRDNLRSKSKLEKNADTRRVPDGEQACCTHYLGRSLADSASDSSALARTQRESGAPLWL